jgi:branched-chain amino acid transport system permease protein
MLLLELFVQGLVQGSIYALVAVGLTLVYGLLRILHVAHAGLYTLGGYLGVTVTNASGSLGLALLVAMVCVGVVGMGIYKLCYQPILRHPPFVALIASIGLFIAMEEIYRLVFGPYGISFNQPPLPASLELFGMRLKLAEIITMAGAGLLIGALAMLSARTRIGIAWRATVTAPEIAESFGIDIEKVRYLNFFVGSALAAAAGVMVVVLNNLVEPTMGSVPSYKALAIIVLGGLGDVRGTLIAALALGVIEAYGTIYLGGLLDRDAIAFAFLIVVLMIRPQGLFGRALP